MQLIAYLNFNGNCEEAFRYYEKHLGGKIIAMMRYEDGPKDMPVSPDSKKKIMHARLTVGDAVLMASDAPPPRFDKPQGFAVSIMIDEPAEADRVFSALGDGGTVTMPIGETFWAKRFGMLVDRFGTPWMVNCEKPM